MKNKKSSICHIITGLNVGGAESMLVKLLHSDIGTFFNNQVITLLPGGYYVRLLQSHGIKVFELDLRTARAFLLSIIRFIKIIRKYDHQVILQGWMYHGNMMALLAHYLRIRSSVLIWNVRQSLDSKQSLNPRTQLLNKFLSYVSRTPKIIIFNSLRSMHLHTKTGYSPVNFKLISNGFDVDKFKPSDRLRDEKRRQIGIDGASFVFGFVGRPDKSKALEILLSAFCRAKNTIDNIFLVLVGAGISEYFNNKKYDGVLFLGHKPDVQNWIPMFDVLCLASLWEGFPNVVGEAMSCAVPCLVTDVGDCSSIVSDTGWIISPGSEDALKNSMISVLSTDKELIKKRGKDARNRILAHYSLQKVVDDYKKMYIAVVN